MDEIDTLLGESEFEAKAADFGGSLEFIDSLNSLPPLRVLNKNDVIALIAGREDTAFSNAINYTAMALPRDNRRFNFSEFHDPGELYPGSSKQVVDRPTKVDRWIQPPGHKPIWLPDRFFPLGRPKPTKAYKRPKLNSLSFADPSRLWICVKRKIRREVMHSLGLSGKFYKPKHFNAYSRVRC